MNRIDSWIFEQKNSLLRLGLFRIIFCFLLVLFILSDNYSEFGFRFDRNILGTESIYPLFYPYLKWAILLLSFIVMLGFKEFIFKWVLLILCLPFFYFFTNNLESLLGNLWSYSGSFPIFLFVLCFSNTSKFSIFNQRDKQVEKRIDSFVLAFFQFYILTMFLQAAISKLSIVGISWFLSGDYIIYYTRLIGTDLGTSLLEYKNIFDLFAIGTGLFQIFGFFIFIYSKKIYGLIALSFHFGVIAILGVAFWFLWPLYLPIFYDFNSSKSA